MITEKEAKLRKKIAMWRIAYLGKLGEALNESRATNLRELKKDNKLRNHIIALQKELIEASEFYRSLS